MTQINALLGLAATAMNFNPENMSLQHSIIVALFHIYKLEYYFTIIGELRISDGAVFNWSMKHLSPRIKAFIPAMLTAAPSAVNEAIF